MREAVEQFSPDSAPDATLWTQFAQGFYYHAGEYTNPDSYRTLGELLHKIERERRTQGNVIFYLATPPTLYAEVLQRLGAAGLSHTRCSLSPPSQAPPRTAIPVGGPLLRPPPTTPRTESEGVWPRIVIEKPFGRDLQSAQALNHVVHQAFQEEQVYRIDHYLGKETVQNILVFRLANGIFEPLWNRNYIDHVQITAAETLGIENRGAYYEQAGALRDMVQNHLLQLLALVAMEPPVTFEAEAVRDEKQKVWQAMHPMSAEEVSQCTVRGQYGAGEGGGKPTKGYRSEDKVSPNSSTETYVAMKFFIDNWRWADVPFYVRSGKRLAKRVTEIVIQFKRVPHMFFQHSACNRVEPNLLMLNIQPDEGISLTFGAKVPGQAICINPVQMEFRYSQSFGAQAAEPYERLLLDCLRGDQTLYARHDGVEAAWALTTPLLEAWQNSPPPSFPNYPAGSWGPAEADTWIAQDGHHWHQ
ncbi:MAG: glucose-6-phosphate dehydrogenase [Elusimicrobia bacterium]|nr:glucose-6-phosphate dehydrogenase [Elusimicrobiota bacterium]